MFKTLFWQPTINLLFLLTNFLSDFGLGVIFTTVVIRGLLWPLFTRNELLQKKMQKIQPEIKQIQTEHKKDPQKQTELLLAIYKNNQINPSFAFIFSFLQIFIIFGLYSAFTVAVRPDFVNNLYPFVSNLININISYNFLGIINLSQANLVFAVLAAAVQVVQGVVTLRYLNDKDPQKNMMKIFTYVFPVIFILNYKHFKSVIFLYWIVITILNVVQTLYIRHKTNKE